MNIQPLHSWQLTPTQAIALQRELAGRVIVETPLLPSCDLIAGADVSYERHSSKFFAGVVVLRTDDLSIVERCGAVADSPFPYIPGLLSFREAPALLEAFKRVQSQPEVVMFDGQGLAHPRRFGIACHVGLWLDLPSIGCAKSLLTGKYKEPGDIAGSTSALRDSGELLGQVVRTKTRVKPLFVSVGHRIELDSAVRFVLSSCRGYRLPEPTRQAHLFVTELRRGEASM